MGERYKSRPQRGATIRRIIAVIPHEEDSFRWNNKFFDVGRVNEQALRIATGDAVELANALCELRANT